MNAAPIGFLIVIAIIAFAGFAVLGGSFYTVNATERGIVQRLGKYMKVVGPGLHAKAPFIDSIFRINTQIQQTDVKIQTKTKDNVFVDLAVSIQHCVAPGKESDAFYKLLDPVKQINSYVYNVIVGHIPTMTLDETFEQQQKVALAVKTELDAVMEAFGYQIVKALVTDISPDAKVAAAMNDINAAARERDAAISRGETQKIIVVKNAEAEAESKKLQGQGIADQRTAIINGLKDSVENFQQAVKGTSAEDVMAMVLMTQYFDTLKEIGATNRSSTLLIPHSPGALTDIFAQIRNAIATGNLLAK